MPRFIAG